MDLRNKKIKNYPKLLMNVLQKLSGMKGVIINCMNKEQQIESMNFLMILTSSSNYSRVFHNFFSFDICDSEYLSAICIRHIEKVNKIRLFM